MKESLMFVGDTHMDTAEILRINEIAKAENVDKIIQVGDFGYIYQDEFLAAIAEASCPWYFIRGNHDSTAWLRDAANVDNMYEGTITRVADNLYWIPDGSVFKFGDSHLAFVGGAASIDKAYRTQDVSWWADEEPSQGCLYRLEEQARGKEIFALVTHDVPARLVTNVLRSAKIHHEPSARAREVLDEAFDIVKPKVSVHGHWHIGYTDVVNDVAVFGLDCEGKGDDNYIILEV